MCALDGALRYHLRGVPRKAILLTRNQTTPGQGYLHTSCALLMCRRGTSTACLRVSGTETEAVTTLIPAVPCWLRAPEQLRNDVKRKHAVKIPLLGAPHVDYLSLLEVKRIEHTSEEAVRVGGRLSQYQCQSFSSVSFVLEAKRVAFC